MQTPNSQEIVKRFFEALKELKNRKKIGGMLTFTSRYGINRRNMYTLERNLESDIFQVEWLTHLVNDYGISAKWLLTGKGNMFAATPIQASSTSHA